MARIVWKRRNVLISIAIFFLIAVALYLIPKYMIFCDNATSLFELEELCRLYSASELTGDLCPALCTDRSLVFHECLHVVHGKVVLRMLWNGTLPVIMKSEHANRNEFLDFNYQRINSDGPLNIPSPSILRDMISNHAESRFGKNFNISHMKTWNVPDSDDGIKGRDVRTLWLLLQQDEYLMMSYLNGHTGVPKLYGSCGHFYVTEFLPPGRHLSSGNFLSKVFPTDWRKRANLAVQLMDIVQAFDSEYHEMLHFCDMKGINFGIDAHREVKAIDLDMAVFETYLMSLYNQVSSCVEDIDCEFFDCKGWCVAPQQRCLPVRINTNLQTLCDKVFVGGIRAHGYVGLLDSPPSAVKFELQEAVNQCSNPPVSELRKLVTDSCQSTLDWSSQLNQEGRSITRNSSYVDELKCREVLQRFRRLLAEESITIYARLRKILLRTNYT